MKKWLALWMAAVMLTCTIGTSVAYAEEASDVEQEAAGVQESDEAESQPEIASEYESARVQNNEQDAAVISLEDEEAVPLSDEASVPELSYRVHVQSKGWQSEVASGATAGTTGESLRLEGLEIYLKGIAEEKGSVEYSTHVQTYGWQDYVQQGELSGTTGQSKRLEAIKIRLTGTLATEYDIYYRTHIQTYGWMDWAKNGESAGSAGFSKRMEALEICLVKKGEAAPGNTGKAFVCKEVEYQVHSQTYGWQSKVYDDQVSGVTGKSKRMEAIQITIPNNKYSGSIEYRTYLQTYGWQEWKKDGEIAGTTGQSKRIEAIEIRLSGEIAQYYDVYYSVHMSKVGWGAYTSNGLTAGSTELHKRIEAIKIQLVDKNTGTAPDTSGVSYIQGFASTDFYYSGVSQDTADAWQCAQGEVLGVTGQKKALENITLYLNNSDEGKIQGDIIYSTHLSNVGWQSETSSGVANGCMDGSTKIEAVKISLSGDIATYYDIYYRVHCQKYGWLGWAKNGQAAGTTQNGYRLEALQIKLVPKDAQAPGSNSNYYTETKYRKYQNPSPYYQIKDSISLSGGGYTLSYGYEGVKVMKVIQRLGLGNGVGMGGAIYGHNVENAVKKFQGQVGLAQTGNVDLLTWIRMGFTQLEWEQWGAYVSPMRVNAESSRSEHIEAMIATAYAYLGTSYVIGASGPPGTGIDCSGLVMQALYSAGIDMSPINPVRHAQPGYEYESRNMWASSQLMKVPYSQRQRGDLIFYQNNNGVVIHVAIYLGNDTVIEAWPNVVVVWPIKNGQRANIKGVARPFI